jgi:alpha-glucosidase
MRELRALVDEYDDKVLIGETDDLAFYGSGKDELHLNFNFPLMRSERMTPAHVSQNQAERLGKLPAGAWPCNTLGNHDCPRMLNRFGDGKHDVQIARANLMLLLSLRGTPFLYNGEEIGMKDIEVLAPEQYRDPLSMMAYEMDKRLAGASEDEAARFGCREGRDKNRTPNQWANAANGGFCPSGVTPWLPINADFSEGVNAEDQENQPDSMLNFYRRAIQTRNHSSGLVAGEYELILASANLFVFQRSFEGTAVLCAFNMGAEPHKYQLPQKDQTYKLLLSSLGGSESERLNTGWIKLAPFEACWIEMQA